MLKDLASNYTIVKESKKIDPERKVSLLRTYLEQLELAFLDSGSPSNPRSVPSSNSPSDLECRQAMGLYIEIQGVLHHLLQQQREE